MPAAHVSAGITSHLPGLLLFQTPHTLKVIFITGLTGSKSDAEEVVTWTDEHINIVQQEDQNSISTFSQEPTWERSKVWMWERWCAWPCRFHTLTLQADGVWFYKYPFHGLPGKKLKKQVMCDNCSFCSSRPPICIDQLWHVWGCMQKGKLSQSWRKESKRKALECMCVIVKEDEEVQRHQRHFVSISHHLLRREPPWIPPDSLCNRSNLPSCSADKWDPINPLSGHLTR